MGYRLLADVLVVVHGVFVLFVVAGGLSVLWRRWMAWVHLPCAAWGAVIEFGGWICPLTPWEQSLRRQAGEAGYSGGFIEHYLIPLIYPAGLTRGLQIVLGVAVLVANIAVYARVLTRRDGDPQARSGVC